MDDTRTFPPKDARPPVDLAITGWLALHQGSPRTSAAYADTITKFRAELVRLGEDVDSDVRTLAMVAHAFATSTSHPGKDRASPATINTRLAILSSFYEYALSRYLLTPMDNAGHILNPITIVKREKIEPYHAIHWLLPEEAASALQQIDRTTLQGKRDYALLVVLLNTGRRLSEVASLHWRHVQIQASRLTLTFESCKGGKTMRDTLSPANSRAVLTWLSAYYGAKLNRLEKDAPVWVTLSRNSQQAGQPLGIQGIQQVCERSLDTHTHVTRHTFTHLMIQAGATLPEIQERLGHESLATTSIYARVFTRDENPHADTITALLGITSEPP